MLSPERRVTQFPERRGTQRPGKPGMLPLAKRGAPRLAKHLTHAPRYPLFLGACAVALVTGCAQTGPMQQAQGARVEPVFRVQQPVSNVAGQYAIARVYLGEGRYDAAIARLRQVLEIDPGFVPAHNALGVAYGHTGRFDLAAQAFREALASGPPAAHLLNNLGFAQMKAGELDEAFESFRRALDLDPENDGTKANVRLLAEARRETSLARPEEGEPVVLQPLLATPSAPPPEPTSAAPAVALTPALTVVPSAERPAALARALAVIPSAESPAPLSVVPPVGLTQPLSVTPAHFITALTQAQAARVLGETPNPAAYEIVTSRASEATLFEVATNVYELQHLGEREVVQQAAQPPRQSTRPAYASASPAAPVPRRVGSPDVVVTAIPSRTAELRHRDDGNDRTKERAILPVAASLAVASPSGVASPLAVASPREVGSSAASMRVAAPLGVAAPLVVATHLGVAAPLGASRPPQAPVRDLFLEAVDGLEVSNGAGVSRLAARTARQLERFGASVTRLTNHPGFGVQRTEIHYRDENLAAALAVQRVLPVHAILVPAIDMHARAKVRLLVGQDLVDEPINPLTRNGHLVI